MNNHAEGSHNERIYLRGFAAYQPNLRACNINPFSTPMNRSYFNEGWLDAEVKYLEEVDARNGATGGS